MLPKRIVVCEEVCIGCHLCEVNCVVAHSVSKDVLKAYKLEAPRPLARVHVEEEGTTSMPVRCLHCEDAPCIMACLTGAMHRDPRTGAVVADSERCMGCWTCVMVCPYGAIVRNVADHHVVKCDLCPDLDTPACVANCPNAALSIVEEVAA